jgi:predicted heme/steroid binding protein
MKELTAEELSSFNGKDGRPIYIAFQGKVYDVTKSPLWAKGLHMNRHFAGKDLTAEISAAPHGTEVLERYPRIGAVKKGLPEELKHLPPLLQNFFQRFPMARRHPHPMIVHFPIALFMAASLFILLTLFFHKDSFEIASFYLLILGAVSSPFAMGTGLLTWWVNYRLKLNYFVKRKIQLSILLLILEVILILWRISQPQIFHPLYVVMMILLSPIVSFLGYYGGQLTFPTEKSDTVME